MLSSGTFSEFLRGLVSEPLEYVLRTDICFRGLYYQLQIHGSLRSLNNCFLLQQDRAKYFGLCSKAYRQQLTAFFADPIQVRTHKNSNPGGFRNKETGLKSTTNLEKLVTTLLKKTLTPLELHVSFQKGIFNF